MIKRGRGQFQISFGVIFSIILIIAFIGVAGYVIVKLINLGKCSEIGLFVEDFEEEVDKAWSSNIYRDSFEGNLPGGIEFVCIGDLNGPYDQGFEEQRDTLYDFYRHNNNFFLYPPEKACNNRLSAHNFEKIEAEEFFCVQVIDGKAEIKMEMNQFDDTVRVFR